MLRFDLFLHQAYALRRLPILTVHFGLETLLNPLLAKQLGSVGICHFDLWRKDYLIIKKFYAFLSLKNVKKFNKCELLSLLKNYSGYGSEVAEQIVDLLGVLEPLQIQCHHQHSVVAFFILKILRKSSKIIIFLLLFLPRWVWEWLLIVLTLKEVRHFPAWSGCGFILPGVFLQIFRIWLLLKTILIFYLKVWIWALTSEQGRQEIFSVLKKPCYEHFHHF